MKKWNQFLLEVETKYSYSSTQVNLPDDVAKKIIKWGENNIDESDVMFGENNSLGRETEIHATILYGLHSKHPDEAIKLLKDQSPFSFTLGKITSFSNVIFDVVKINVEGPELHKLNKLLKALPYTSKFPIYKPHVTIAYVKKGKAEKYIGNDVFSGIKIKADKIVYSSQDGNKTTIKLKNKS